MLSLPNDGRYPALELTPQQRRQKTLEALHAQVETFASKNPVLMIFEDAHWSDPTSLEAFGRAVDRIPNRPVLLLITFRPEFEPSWIGQPHVSAVTLNRLTQREVNAMIDRVAGNKPLPANIRRDIVERTDGIPLFVEEMTKAVLEAESVSVAAEALAMVPRPALAVPASLHASLMGRLDRLGGPAKEVAQIGAAIGREFSHVLLAAVVPKPEAELQSTLDLLVSAGLLFRQGVPPYATYLFKHALVQDAAYGTLLREPRRALHARIADTLERQFAEIAENQPELLARHCTEAGLIEKAASLWGKAAQRSLERSALVEAIAQLTRAIGQIASLPRTGALRQQEIKLQVALITPMMHVKGYTASETKAAAERARLLMEQAKALGEPPEDPLLLFSVLYAHWVANLVAFNGQVARGLATQFLALAKKHGSTTALMIAHRLMGTSLAQTGDLVESRTHYDQAVALYDPAEHRPLATRFGQDHGVAALSFRSHALWVLGYPAAALADAEQALKNAHEIGQAATLIFALMQATGVHRWCGYHAIANAHADKLYAMADEKGAAFWKSSAVLVRGEVLALTGNVSDAIVMLTSGLSAFRSNNVTFTVPHTLVRLAIAYAELGQFVDARSSINEAVQMIETTGQKIIEAEVLRVAGEIALKEPQPDATKAQSYFERALAIARQQQAKSWELRAAMSLARLWRDQGKVQQAREPFAPVYGWFTEGFDTLDLKEAKALLEELVA